MTQTVTNSQVFLNSNLFQNKSEETWVKNEQAQLASKLHPPKIGTIISENNNFMQHLLAESMFSYFSLKIINWNTPIKWRQTFIELHSPAVHCKQFLKIFVLDDLPVIGSVLSFPENTMGLETGVGILRALSFGAVGAVSDFDNAFGDGGRIAPVCLAKKLRMSSFRILLSFPVPITSLNLIWKVCNKLWHCLYSNIHIYSNISIPILSNMVNGYWSNISAILFPFLEPELLAPNPC